MKASHVKTFLKAAIAARKPVLLVSAPGSGKSDIVKQVCTDVDADVIESHPAVSDPTDAKGLPWVINGLATFLPFGELQRAIDAIRLTVWILEDLGQASAAVQASFMQLLLARRVNGHKISDFVTFIACTNRRIDRAGVTGILEPVKSRFASIVELTVDCEEWAAWAVDNDVQPKLIAFLRFRSELLCKFEATADLTNSPVPRTWGSVSSILTMGLPADVQHEAISGAVGEAAAVELSAFLKLYAELPTVDQILIDPSSVQIPTKPATLYAIAGAVAARTTVQNFARVAEFCTRLADEAHGEFAMLLLKDAMRKTPKVQETKAYTKLITGDLSEFFTGQAKR